MKLHTLYGYYYNIDHVTKECLDLVTKWEEKIGSYNMVSIKLCNEEKL